MHRCSGRMDTKRSLCSERKEDVCITTKTTTSQYQIKIWNASMHPFKPNEKMFTCYEKHGGAYKSMLLLFHEYLFLETIKGKRYKRNMVNFLRS